MARLQNTQIQYLERTERQTDKHHGNSATIRSNERIARRPYKTCLDFGSYFESKLSTATTSGTLAGTDCYLNDAKFYENHVNRTETVSK